jgi:hypothetical protein
MLDKQKTQFNNKLRYSSASKLKAEEFLFIDYHSKTQTVKAMIHKLRK